MGSLTTCTPRTDVLSGDLKDAIFAGDFGDVLSNHPGTAEVYRDPQLFFRNTHPARDLTRIVREVFSVLSKGGEPGLALRLSTGFGGGKTDTLLTLWHLARNIGAREMGTELLPATGRPTRVHVAAVDGAKAGHPVFAQHGGVVVKSLAGELGVEAVRTGSVIFAARDPGSRFVIEFVNVEVSGEPQAIEHDELRWVDIDELTDLALAPSDQAFVTRALRAAGTQADSDRRP